MIVAFSIQNFGSVREKQTLSFEADKSTHLEDHLIIRTNGGLRLLKLALIYGANASGKTTILKALDFLRKLVLEPAEKKSDQIIFNPFLLDGNSATQNSVLSLEFIQNDVRHFYEVEFNKYAVVREELYFYNPNKANVLKRTTDIKSQFTEISFGSKIKIEKAFENILEANTLWNNTVLGGFLKTNIKIQELNDVINWFTIYLNPLILSNTQLDNFISSHLLNSTINKFDLIDVLKKADFNITDIFVQEKQATRTFHFSFVEDVGNLDYTKYRKSEIEGKRLHKIEFEHTIENSTYTLPYSIESQGTQRYYGLAGLLSLLVRNSICLPIDEIDSSLHPDLFLHFLVTFLINSKDSQLIASTYNREMLNNKDLFRNDTIWFTDKSESSATELYSLADFDSSVVRDTSNVLNAYKTGKLGGIPNLGDQYFDFTHEKK